MAEDDCMTEVASWIGRSVEIIDGIEGTIGEKGVVLYVDDREWRPAGWVKTDIGCYRSVDLCWLQDVATGDIGPTWGTGHHEA